MPSFLEEVAKQSAEGFDVLTRFNYFLYRWALPGVPVCWVVAFLVKSLWPEMEDVYGIPTLVTIATVVLFLKAKLYGAFKKLMLSLGDKK